MAARGMAARDMAARDMAGASPATTILRLRQPTDSYIVVAGLAPAMESLLLLLPGAACSKYIEIYPPKMAIFHPFFYARGFRSLEKSGTYHGSA